MCSSSTDLKIREVLQTEFRFRFRKGPRQISTGPGWSTPEEVEPNFVLQTEFSFSVRFDQAQEVCSVGDSLHRDVQEHYREVESLLATRPLLMELAGPSRSPTERLAK